MAQRTEFTNLFLKILLIPSSVLDPDLDWILIQGYSGPGSEFGIWIRGLKKRQKF